MKDSSMLTGGGERSSSLADLPPADPDVKEQEANACFGDEVEVRCLLFHEGDDLDSTPPYQTLTMKTKQGYEVKRFRVLLGEQLKVDHKLLRILYNGRALIDPISLVDGWGEQPTHYNIQVLVKEQ